MKLELVAHCWHYPRALTWQMSSLVNSPPLWHDVTYALYYCPEDGPTVRVIDFFAGMRPGRLEWSFRPLERTALLRRAIGRNRAALATDADWVWFADCDMMFLDGCLDHLGDVLAGVPQGRLLVYPRSVMMSRTHADGDRLIESAGDVPAVLTAGAEALESFRRERYNRAIGGVQIIRGDVCRDRGYCKGTRWQTPCQRWMRTYEDTAVRRSLGTRGYAVRLPGVYRIRHTRHGRFDEGVSL